MSFHYKMIAATDVGNVRSINEDSLRIIPSLNLAVVADGMGGHKAGDVASRMSVNTLCNFYEEQSLITQSLGQDQAFNSLAEAFSMANSEVYANSHQLEHCEGMGTTLLAASFQGEHVHIGHIGDSRLYRFARGTLEQLTIDHTLAVDLLADNPGGTVPAYSYHVLRKALGIESSCQPDLFITEASASEIYLLCSDGLCGVVDDSDIATILSLRSSNPEHCIETLIDVCLDNGGPDNVSVILVFVS